MGANEEKEDWCCLWWLSSKACKNEQALLWKRLFSSSSPSSCSHGVGCVSLNLCHLSKKFFFSISRSNWQTQIPPQWDSPPYLQALSSPWPLQVPSRVHPVARRRDGQGLAQGRASQQLDVPELVSPAHHPAKRINIAGSGPLWQSCDRPYPLYLECIGRGGLGTSGKGIMDNVVGRKEKKRKVH